MPAELRPYEKFEKYGADLLTDAELLAIIIRTGSAKDSALELAAKVLALCPYREGLDGLSELSLNKLKGIPGIGRVKAIQIKSIAELSKRISMARAVRKADFTSAGSIADYYMERLRNENREMVFCMMLDTRNSLIADICLSIGTVNYAPVSVREIFSKALEYHAVSIVLVHNHPSGDPTPSAEDLAITKQIRQAGLIIGISLLDHIIIGQKCFTSIIQSCETEQPV